MKYYKELILFEGIIFVMFWLSNEYLAFLLSMVSIPVFTGIMVVAFIAERIEKTNISSDFFKFLLGLIIVPLLLFIVFFVISGGQFAWMNS